jgi:aspartate carbamoyltransferase catalytic subunit
MPIEIDRTKSYDLYNILKLEHSNLTWTRRHILSLADFTPDEYDTVLQTAASFKEVLSRPVKKVPTLQGRVVANLFFESSTRTRSSFELAAKRLKGRLFWIPPKPI